MFQVNPKGLLAAAALVCTTALGFAQIERLDLPQMVAKTDNAVVGKIVDKKVVRIDDEVDGPELYYTTLTIEGTSLYDGTTISVPVTFAGGFISPTEGANNSEAPAADEVRLGNEVVAFYKWTNNMGGGMKANQLYAAHGGIYRVAQTRNGQVALGKGDGYALSSNVRVADLRTQISKIRTK